MTSLAHLFGVNWMEQAFVWCLSFLKGFTWMTAEPAWERQWSDTPVTGDSLTNPRDVKTEHWETASGSWQKTLAYGSGKCSRIPNSV